MSDDVTMFYFGPWDRPGHFLHGERGHSVMPWSTKAVKFPWTESEIDARLQPHLPECSQRTYCGCGGMREGLALLHHKHGWTALAFWDRSVDKRGNSNSTYFARGTFTFEQMVEMAKERFAERWNKMAFAVEPYCTETANQ